MKLNTKQIMALALTIVMLLTFSACGNGNNNSDTPVDDNWDIEVNQGDSNGLTSVPEVSVPNNGGGQVAAPTIKDPDSLSLKQLMVSVPKELRGTTLKGYFWGACTHNNVVDDFEKKTGIKVEWKVGNYENYDTNIAALIQAGDAPDIIKYNCENPARIYLTQDLKTATGYDFKGDIWNDAIRSVYTIKGKTYGINLQNTYFQQPWIVAYAKSTVERYKMEDPYTLWKQGKWTFDKMKEMCIEFKQATTRSAWMTSNHLDLLAFRGLLMINFDGNKYSSNVRNPKIQQTLQEITTMHQVTGIVSSAMREHDKLENGTYLFFTDNIIGQRRNDFHFTTLKAQNDLCCVPFPTQEGYSYYQPFHEAEAYGVPKGAKNAPAVYYFLRYYLDADNYDENMFFINAQAADVYQWCMSQKNKVFGCAGELTKSIGNQHGGLSGEIKDGLTPEQVKNKLDEVENVYIRAAEEGNRLIAKF